MMDSEDKFTYEGVGLVQPNHMFSLQGSFEVHDEMMEAVEEWCKVNCEGTYFVDDWHIAINSDADAFAFRLRWC